MTERNLAIRLTVLDGGKVKAELREVGETGEKSLKKIELAGNPASAGLKAVNAAANDVRGAVAGMASQLGPVGAGLSALGPYGIAAAAAIAGLSIVFKGAYAEAAKAEQSFTRMEAVLKATGYAAGLTANEITAFADQLEAKTLATAEDVQDAAGILSTFGSVSGEAFKLAITYAQDLAAVWRTDLAGATTKIGKALNDPIDGLTALKKAGVTFTQSQRDMIQAFVEGGQKAEAQKIVLDALKGSLDGSGAAEAQGLTGATNRLHDAWGNFLESVGQTSIVGGAASSFITRLAQAFEGLRGAIDGPAPVDSAAAIAQARAGAERAASEARAEQLYEQRKKIDETLAKLVDDPAEKISKVNQELAKTKAQLNGLRDTNTSGSVDSAIAEAEKLAKTQIDAINKPAMEAASKAAEANQKVIDDLTRGLTGIADKRQAFIEQAVGRLSKDASKADKADARRLATQLFDQQAFADAQKVIDDLEDKIKGVSDKRAAFIKEAIDRASVGAAPEQVKRIEELAGALYDQGLAEERLKKLKEDGATVTKATQGATAAYAEEVKRLKELLDAGAISQDTYNVAMANAGKEQLKGRKDAEAGAQRAFLAYREQAEDSASAVEAAFTKGMKATEDAITDAVTSGGASLSSLGDLANSIVADITRMMVQKSITGPLFNAISSGMGEGGALEGILGSIFHEGGIAGGAAPSRRVPAAVFAGAPRYHSGGIAGLKPNEVPAILERGERIIPKGGRAGSMVNVTMNITTPDANSFRSSQAQVTAEAAKALDRAKRNL